MARQTTKKKVESPEVRADVIAEEIKSERGLDALHAEILRLNGIIVEKDRVIKSLQTANEDLSDELSKARNK